MQLLKRRKFGDNFNDTFALLKQNGKHFFKNYFILNGLPLIILLFVMYFFVSSFYGLSTFQTGDNFKVFEDYVSNNLGLFTLIAFVSVIIFIIFIIIQISFTPIYLILYQKNNGANFDHKDILRIMFKERLGKILIFILVGLILLIPVIIVGAIIGFLLIFTIFGNFLLFAYILLWYNNALMEYLDSNKGIFECFGYSFELLKINFWANVGAIALFILMTTFISAAISMVMSMATAIFSANTISGKSRETIVIISMLVSFILSNSINIFIQTIVQIAQGMVYYGAKEEKENIVVIDEIDKIGLSE